MPLDRRAITVLGLTLTASAAAIWAIRARGDEVIAALERFPAWALVACAALHLIALAARSEAWRIALGAIEGRTLQRSVVHGANAGAFCAGALMAHTSMPVRIALLRRLARDDSPRIAQIVVADLPIFLLEIFWASVLLALTQGAWALPISAGLLAGGCLLARVLRGRPAARGLAVLADRRGATIVGAWVGVVTFAGAIRVWLILTMLLLPAHLAAIGSNFAALGIFGLLPIGPASQAAGGAAASSDALSDGLAAGLIMATSALLAVVVYACALGLIGLAARRSPDSRPA